MVQSNNKVKFGPGARVSSLHESKTEDQLQAVDSIRDEYISSTQQMTIQDATMKKCPMAASSNSKMTRLVSPMGFTGTKLLEYDGPDHKETRLILQKLLISGYITVNLRSPSERDVDKVNLPPDQVYLNALVELTAHHGSAVANMFKDKLKDMV